MFKEEIKENVMKPLLNGGFQVYFVGGCVRDEILGKQPNDYDIVTNATPEQIHNIFDKFVDINSEAFGITVININGENVEIATFRKDRECDGRHTNVTYANTIEEDSQRRDLTINALYEDINDTVLDPTECGLIDIRNRKIRFIGNAKERCREDNLRILRAYRFMFTLNFDLDCNTKKDMKSLLSDSDFIESFNKRVSAERIGKEIKKLFNADILDIDNLREMIIDTKLLNIFPIELYQLVEQPVHTKYHLSINNFEHTLKSLKRVSIKHDYIIRFAVLFHDLGKAIVQDENGKALEHEIYSANITREFLYNRYRFTNKEIDKIVTIVENHMIMHQLHEHKRLYKVWKFLGKFDTEMKQYLELMLESDCMDSTQEIKDIDKFRNILSIDYMKSTPYPTVFSGKDFLEYLEGPKIKRAIELANDSVAREILRNNFDFSKESIVKQVVNACK